MIRRIASLILVSGVPAFVRAQPVPDVVVTASRLRTPADTTPYPVQIIPEARLIARDGVADALSDIADLYVQAPGGRSGQAAVFLRGADPNFTAVLLDGVPLNNSANALGGAVNVSEIASAGIARIEVVAGPLSSLYGSGALAGVVNLVVPSGGVDHAFEARAGLGTAEDVSGFLRWRGPVAAGLGASLAATFEDAGDVSPVSSFRSASVIGKIAPLGEADAGRGVFRIADTRSSAFPDASGGPRLAVIRTGEERRARESLIGLARPFQLAPALRLDVSGSFLHRRDRTRSPGVAGTEANPVGVPGGEDETRYARAIGQGAVRYDGEPWQAIAGIEAQNEDARSAGILELFGMRLPSSFARDRWTGSGFAEVSRSTADLAVNAGARLDRVDGLGTHLTGRLGVRYHISGTGLTLRAAAGTGFKAPSFYALGNPFVGNPALEPERSRAIEAGIGWADRQGTSLAATAFYTRYTDLIDFVPDPVPRLENRSAVTSRGVSATAARDFGRLAASAQLLYADTYDRDGGERLLNRPRWRSSAALTWRPAAALSIAGRHRYTGGRLAFSVPTGVASLSSYHAVSFDAAYAAGGGMTLRLVLDNALDGDNEDAVGFEAPGRRARILLSQDF